MTYVLFLLYLRAWDLRLLHSVYSVPEVCMKYEKAKIEMEQIIIIFFSLSCLLSENKAPIESREAVVDNILFLACGVPGSYFFPIFYPVPDPHSLLFTWRHL